MWFYSIEKDVLNTKWYNHVEPFGFLYEIRSFVIKDVIQNDDTVISSFEKFSSPGLDDAIYSNSTLCNENENFVHSIAAAWWIDGTA